MFSKQSVRFLGINCLNELMQAMVVRYLCRFLELYGNLTFDFAVSKLVDHRTIVY